MFEGYSVKVIVCICTYRRTELLQRLLLSLRHIQIEGLDPNDVAVIVVDNDPDGLARKVCERVSGHLPIELIFVEETNRGRPYARNRAVDEALGRDASFIAFIDDDDLPEPDWLLRLVEKQRETQADIVFGAESAVFQADWPEWLKHAPLFKNADAEGFTKYLTPKGISTYNVLIRRSVIDRLKAAGMVFSPEFTRFEDTDFFIRAAKNKATFARAENSVIHRNYEPHRLSARGLLREALLSGIYTMRLLKKHGSPVQIKQRKRKALKKMTLALLKLPICMFSMVSLMHNLFILSREFGVVRTYSEKSTDKVTVLSLLPM